jgi:hypothetical protein
MEWKMTKRTRRKIDAVLKARIALEALPCPQTIRRNDRCTSDAVPCRKTEK